MFAFSQIDAAYKAGIFDIIPAENERYHMEGLAMLAIQDALWIIETIRNLKEPKHETFDNFWVSHYWIPRISKLIDDKYDSLAEPREKCMCKKIIGAMDNTQRGALICGAAHVKPIKKMLSEKFKVKKYYCELGLIDQLFMGLYK